MDMAHRKRPSPILWPGDKTLLEEGLLPWIAPLSPSGRVFDPMCGSVALHLMHAHPLGGLGDADKNLVDLLHEIQSNLDALKGEAIPYFSMPGESQAYPLANQRLTHRFRKKRAASFLYINRASRFPHVRYSLEGRFHLPFYLEPVMPTAQLDALHRRLQGVKVRCEDYHWVVDKLQAGDCVLFDPPYMDCGRMYRNNGRYFDYTELVRVCRLLRERSVRVVLTLNYSPEAVEFSKDADHRFQLRRMTASCHFGNGVPFTDLICIYQKGLVVPGAEPKEEAPKEPQPQPEAIEKPQNNLA